MNARAAATEMQSGATAALAAFIAATEFEALPPAVVAHAKASFIDTLGIAIAGAVEPGGRIVLDYSRGTGGRRDASLIGGGAKVPAAAAAMANATLAHIVGFSDFSVATLLHPSVAVLPAAWAVGEARGASGRQVIAAHAIGVEVTCKIARTLTPAFTQRGFHPCAAVGTFGAAAAAAKLEGLDARQTAHALGIVGVRAGGIKVSLGSMSKAYAVGHAAEGGVVAAEMAALGYTGATDVLEGADGFFQTFGAGVAPIDFAAVLGRPFEFTEPGITIKPYPSCTRSHPAVDAALQVAGDPSFRAEAVEAVECEVAPAVLQVVKIAHPRNAMEAKFSLPYCVAAALLDRSVAIETFRDDRLGDPAIRALMKVVAVKESRALADHGPFAARLTVRMTDGTVLRAGADRNLWDGVADVSPAMRQQLVEKFSACAGRWLGRRDIEDIVAIVDRLEEESSLDRLMAIAGAAHT